MEKNKSTASQRFHVKMQQGDITLEKDSQNELIPSKYADPWRNTMRNIKSIVLVHNENDKHQQCYNDTERRKHK